MEDKNLIEGQIKEIRTSDDGCYDDACNCWSANLFLIITDMFIYKFSVENNWDDGGDDCWWNIEKIADYDKIAFPFSLKTFTEKSFIFNRCYMDERQNPNDIEIQYEDVSLWICPMPEYYTLFSVQQGKVLRGDEVIPEDNIRSKYIAWDEFEDYYLIEFENND